MTATSAKNTTSVETPAKRNNANVKTIFREVVKPDPIEKVNSQMKYVSCGVDNLYFQFLNGLYYTNPVHGGIINQKVKFITAGGITVQGGGDASILDNGTAMYNLQEVVETVALDFEIAECFAILFTRNNISSQWEAAPMDVELIRVNETPGVYHYSRDWGKTPSVKTGYRKIVAIENVKLVPVAEGGDTECLMVCITRPKQRIIKGRELTQNYYPVPNYSGAIIPIMTSIEMDFFALSEVVNGFKGGTLINLANGIPESEKEEDEIIDRIKGEATTRNRQGGITVTFSDGKERAPTVEQINGNDLDKRYLETGKAAIQKTMIAHGVISPALFGVLSETMFGSKEEMGIAYELFQENYVSARQRNIMAPINWALKKLNGFQGKVEFVPYVPGILKTVEPTTPAQMERMSVEDTERVLGMFGKAGIPREGSTVLHSAEYSTFTDNEEEFKTQFLAGRFAGLTDEERKVLRLIQDGKSYAEISRTLGKGGVYLSRILFTLNEGGYTDGWKVTDKAVKEIAEPAAMKVMYSYHERPDAPPLVGPSSRPFCEQLLKFDRLYTRQEIDAITDAIGRDVWTYRGGWYHNPETKKNTPFCRHIWKQNIVLA